MENIKHDEFTTMWQHVSNARSYEVMLMDENRKTIEINSIDANIFYDNYYRFQVGSSLSRAAQRPYKKAASRPYR